MGWTRWQSGTWVLYLRSRHALEVSGRLRFERDAAGFYADYEYEGDDLAMQPHFSEIVAVRELRARAQVT